MSTATLLPIVHREEDSAPICWHVIKSRVAVTQESRQSFSADADSYTDLSEDVLQRLCERVVENRAQSLLRQSPYYPVRQVTCKVLREVIVLQGRVPSYYMKQIAQTVVRGLCQGNWKIENQLEVD